jgi:hypothetical protein
MEEEGEIYATTTDEDDYGSQERSTMAQIIGSEESPLKRKGYESTNSSNYCNCSRSYPPDDSEGEYMCYHCAVRRHTSTKKKQKGHTILK